MKQNFTIILSILISILIHIAFLNLKLSNTEYSINKNEPTMPINIRNDKKKYKKVGVRKSKSKNTVEATSKKSKLLDFLKRLTEKTISNYSLTGSNTLRYSRSVKSIVPNAPAELVSKSKFGLKITPPKGTSFNKLNSMEKVLHGFNVRIFKKFVSTFFSTLEKLKSNYPNLHDTLKNNTFNLIGKMVFDLNGNIVSIKIIKSSTNDQVHELFENTLTNINQIQNPPKIIINDKNQFVLYFHLDIND